VLVDTVKRRRVGPWRLQTVSLLALLPNSASSSGHPKEIFRPGKRICCLGECEYIAAFPSGVWSTSDIERGSGPRSLLLVHIHLIFLCDVDSVEVSIESRHASPELASTLASFHDDRSYSFRVCFPGSAASTRLECLPMFSGKH
jgi:hypothetical protein